jgi:hexokinase
MKDLPSELQKELDQLEKQFWVDQQKLKEITKRFVEELEEGTP